AGTAGPAPATDGLPPRAAVADPAPAGTPPDTPPAPPAVSGDPLPVAAMAPPPPAPVPVPAARPAAGLRSTVPGVVTGGLPQVGAPAAPRPEAAPGVVPSVVTGVVTGRLPQIGAPADPASVPPVAEAAADDTVPLPAWAAHARDFDNPSGKPPFAIILLDAGQGDIDRAALAAGPVPITLAIDPAAPRAPEIAAAWRAAGQEVLILGAALPAAPRAADAEVAVEALAGLIPQAVGLIDAPLGGVQGDRTVSAMLIGALAPRGLGIVTWDRGLNSAEQIARREAVPSATVFRDLDGAGESAVTIRRYLDRAAFRAAQEGRVVVAGRLTAETVAAIAAWTLEPRAATVALAPVSAIFALP
ncbi:MAG: divergent polysaccharide deacetylase family protein, partial [Gemmobacter sp.]